MYLSVHASQNNKYGQSAETGNKSALRIQKAAKKSKKIIYFKDKFADGKITLKL
jgi:hypothetical protein